MMIPRLLVKFKEEMMSLVKDLDDLYCAAYHISQGINAPEVMALGLASAKDPYADGFNALHNYLFDANQELQQYLTACLNAIS